MPLEASLRTLHMSTSIIVLRRTIAKLYNVNKFHTEHIAYLFRGCESGRQMAGKPVDRVPGNGLAAHDEQVKVRRLPCKLCALSARAHPRVARDMD